MLAYTGKLINVQTGDFNSLVFAGTKWDVGLQKEVEASVNIAISKDHLYLVDEYRKSMGNPVSIPVRAGVTKKGGIWYATAGNGRSVVHQPTVTKVA